LFDDTGFGARAAAFGPAYTALADDVSAVYYNPGGLGFQKYNSVGISGSKLYWGLGANNPSMRNNSLYSLSMAYVQTLKFMVLGAGVSKVWNHELLR